jgi:hypothetical protein
MSANWESGYESAFQVAGIEKRSSAFDLVALLRKTGVHCSGKCPRAIGINSVFQGGSAKKYIEFLKLREETGLYT